MSDAVTSHFVTMGSEPLTSHLVNISGERSPYTMPVPRKHPSSDVLATGGKANRGSILMSGEHNGPRFRPQTTIFYPNAPEASGTGRGMRVMSSSQTPFWDQRGSQSGEVIR